jgi:hypothetical protein
MLIMISILFCITYREYLLTDKAHLVKPISSN